MSAQPLSGELFAGTGMLGRAVGEVFGTRPGWFCEFDAAPSKVLAHALGAERDDEGDRQGNVTGEVSSWGPYGAAIARWESVMGRPAPSPVRVGDEALARWKRQVARRRAGKDRRPVGMRGSLRMPSPSLNPELTEWMMGWPAGWVTASVIGLSRGEQLKACGNGVVLQQAIAALRMLLARPGVPAVDWELAA